MNPALLFWRGRFQVNWEADKMTWLRILDTDSASVRLYNSHGIQVLVTGSFNPKLFMNNQSLSAGIYRIRQWSLILLYNPMIIHKIIP